MTKTTEEFFDELGRRDHEPLLEKVTGTLRVDLVRGKRTEHWLLAVRRGDLAVSHRNTKADCVLRADGALFDRIASGEANAMAALLRGEMGVEGDVELLVLFQRLFPGPPASRDRRRAAGYARRQS